MLKNNKFWIIITGFIFIVAFGLTNWGISTGFIVTTSNTPVIFSFLSAFFTAFTALVSLGVVLEMRKDRETLSKPDVYADFEVNDGLFIFFIQNFGRSPAKQVQLMINPIPIKFNKQKMDNVKWLFESIETLLPGKKYEIVLDSTPGMLKSDNPKIFTIKIEYKSLSGKKYQEGPYQIDLEEYRYTSVLETSLEKSIKRIADSLAKIESAK